MSLAVVNDLNITSAGPTVSLINTTSVFPPHPVPPTAPDFAICDQFYGSYLEPEEARYAGMKLNPGAKPFDYILNKPSEPFHLPFTVSHGNIAINVEPASPFAIADLYSIRLVPNRLRGLAGHLITTCVENDRLGGYATFNIGHLLDYVVNSDVDIYATPYPPSTAFVTVTLGIRHRYLPPPGNYDPDIATAIAAAEERAGTAAPAGRKGVFAKRKALFKRQAVEMRVLLKAWWEFWKHAVSNNGMREEAGDGTADEYGDGKGVVQEDVTRIPTAIERSNASKW